MEQSLGPTFRLRAYSSNYELTELVFETLESVMKLEGLNGDFCSHADDLLMIEFQSLEKAPMALLDYSEEQADVPVWAFPLLGSVTARSSQAALTTT